MKYNSHAVYLNLNQRKNIRIISLGYNILEENSNSNLLTNSLIFKKKENEKDSSDFFVPLKTELNEIFMFSHKKTACAGINSTYLKTLEFFVKFNHMTDRIDEVITKCSDFNSNKSFKKIKKDIRFVSLLPFDVVFMDLKQIRFECSYKYILNIKDHLSKKLYSYPLKDKSAPNVADALKIFFQESGARFIWCDNGTEFINDVVKELLRINTCIMKNGKPYTPQTQGLIEKTHMAPNSYI